MADGKSNKSKQRMGRPPKCTPEVVAALELAIRNGATVEDACTTVGVSKQTYYTWRELGEQRKKPYTDFLDTIKKAEVADKQWHINNIRSHAAKSWQASAWYLERRHPSEWGRREAIDPNYGQDAAAVKLVIEDDTEEPPPEGGKDKEEKEAEAGDDVGEQHS